MLMEILKINLIGILLNLTLDPILIYGCGQGVSGAAWASLIANGVMTLLFYSRFRPLFRFQPSIGFERKAAWDIVRLGFPMALQRILFTFVNIVLAKCIAIFGQEAIAAQKIGLQLESIVFMVIGGINGAIASFVGQNHGAKQNDRIRIGVNYALGLAVGYAAVASLLFILIPRPLTLLFIQEEHPIRMTCHYLQVIACSQLFSAIEMVLNGFFTGIKRPNIPALISIIYLSSNSTCPVTHETLWSHWHLVINCNIKSIKGMYVLLFIPTNRKEAIVKWKRYDFR